MEKSIIVEETTQHSPILFNKIVIITRNLLHKKLLLICKGDYIKTLIVALFEIVKKKSSYKNINSQTV